MYNNYHKHFILAICILVQSQNANAEFYVWVDEKGVKHVSMIPREGFNPDGTVKDEYNPNAFAYQHKRLPRYLNKIFRQMEKGKETETKKWHAYIDDVMRKALPESDATFSNEDLNAIERHKVTNNYSDLPDSIRWANDNTDSDCIREVQKVRELGNHPDFETNKNIRIRWQNQFAKADKMGCTL